MFDNSFDISNQEYSPDVMWFKAFNSLIVYGITILLFD